MKAKGPLRIGFDLGTNTSVVQADGVKLKTDLVHTVVGYARPGVLPGVLPDNRTVFFGDEALEYRRYLDLKWPLEQGIVRDIPSARDFIGFVRSLLPAEDGAEVWCVVGAPARTSEGDLENLRMALGRAFARFLIVPEPFLAALGIRDESRLKDPNYLDPVKHSLVVDIGAGTTDLCVLQGFYPTEKDTACFPKAGNDIDALLRELIERRFPDVRLHNVSITRLKEENSYVGTPDKKIELRLYIHGRERVLDVTELVGQACSILIDDIVRGVLDLSKRCDQEIADRVLSNIILTGGGSQIRNLAETIEARLKSYGLATARVQRAENYKHLVAQGALKVAKMARDDQWQIPSLD
jgi:rod shape-determining protein MreB